MTYRIENPLEHEHNDQHRIVIVGCGGTGGFVAEGLMRLFLPRPDIQLVLVDHDTVNERNLLRQNFNTEDVGKFKAEALALRFAKQFGRPVAYSLDPLNFEMLQPWRGMNGMYTTPALVITCVDNALARQAMARWCISNISSAWWIDVGNGKNWGQVLIGNSDAPSPSDETSAKRSRGALRSAWFSEKKSECQYLPLPHIQSPELLIPTREEVLDPDCAEAVALGEQSPVINKAMATLVMEFVRRLMAGELTWMQARIDLDSFMLKAVDATPENVARILKVKPNTLISKE